MDAVGIPRGGRELRAQVAYLSGVPDRLLELYSAHAAS